VRRLAAFPLALAVAIGCVSADQNPFPARPDAADADAPPADAPVGDGQGDDSAPAADGPAGDVTPPSFAGPTAVTADTAYSLVVAWTPASDDHTPPEFIEYRIYVGPSPGTEDTSNPASVTVGATGGLVGGLSPNSGYCVVVAALDRAGNRTLGAAEGCAQTPGSPGQVGFAAQVEPLMQDRCAMVLCHCCDGPAAGMDLSTAPSALASLVSQPSDGSRLLRVQPFDSGRSFLIYKLRGLVSQSGDQGDPMPPPGMGVMPLSDPDIDLIREWIDQGALDN
jgi:hypothetical protein